MLQLSAKDFNDRVICLGPQVAAVLDALTALPELANASWYAAGFDMIWPEEIREALRPYEANDPVLIDNIRGFIPLVRKVGQFLDGVFFSVQVGQEPIVVAEFLASDGPIEKLVANSIVEVCAADTSLIWIGTDIPSIIERMQGRFGGKTLQSTADE